MLFDHRHIPSGMVDVWSLAAAAAITVVTTVCCAWRWLLVARGLGVAVPLPVAVAAYYRSQFLNTTLPGGVVGDVHRGVSHGREVGDLGRGLRAVAWERAAGQAVQVALAVVVLLLLPSPVRSSMPVVAGAVVAAVLGTLLLGRALPRRGPSALARSVRTVTADLRGGRCERPHIDHAGGVDERVGAHPSDEDGEDRDSDQGLGPGPPRPTHTGDTVTASPRFTGALADAHRGTANRSRWCTVTCSRAEPASSARRRR